MKYLVDANVWLALVAGGHVHHSAAQAWFRTVGDGQAALIRLTHLTLLRLVTAPQVMRERVLSVDLAWTTFEALRMDSRVTFLTEPEGIEDVWLELIQQHPAGHKTWTDAYLAGFAEVIGATLVTFDRALAKWRRPAVLVLE